MLLAALTAGTAAAGPPPAPPDPGFGGALDVGLALTDTAGVPIERPAAGVPFRVVATLAEPGAGRPAAAAHPSGWIRPVETSNGTCSAAARAYFATDGALPRGGTNLERSLYAVRHEDGTVSIVDWERSIASANILAMTPAPALVGPLVPDPAAFAFVGPTADGGRVRIDAAEGTTAVPLPADAPDGDLADAPALATPDGWLARGVHLHPPGGATVPLPAPAVALAAVPPVADGAGPGALVLLADGRALLADPAGRLAPPVAGPAGATAAARSAEAGATLFVTGAARAVIDYGAGARIEVPLPAPASRIAVAPGGALALAWAPGSPAVSLLDVATGSLVQAVELNRAPLDQGVREAVLAEGLAVLLLDRLDFAVVIDLAQARRGEPAAVRPVRLGPAVASPPAGGGPYLLASRRGPGVLALHPDLATVFPIMRDSGNASAPMNGFRIRGARPLSIAELAGGLVPAGPGRYAAATVLATGGPHEVVVSGGPGRFTACARFDVDGPAATGLALRLEAVAAPAAVGAATLELRILDGDGVPQAWPGGMPLLLQSLDGGWRASAVAAPIDAERHRATFADLPSGEISVAFDQALPPGVSVRPATFALP